MSETRRRYAGEQIEISYDAARCIHAEECVRGLPAVFDSGRRPWIIADGAPADAVADVVARCPSGALRYARRDGGPEEQAPPANSVRVAAAGPLYLHGRLRLVGPDGSARAEELRAALCRCGQSRNKPYCDNSHRAAGFADPGLVPAGDEGAGGDGALVVTLAANGPLLLRGPFTISDADGAATFQGASAALCRCGGSGRKPFCDGTHRHNGFSDQEVERGE